MRTRNGEIVYRLEERTVRHRVGSDAVAAAARLAADRSAVVIVDTAVRRRHPALVRRLAGGGRRPVLVLPGGEAVKTPQRLVQVWRFLARHALPRDGLLLAAGGGTVLDLAGLAAATWHRGTAWAAVATTLLAAVDAAIGGKTAVDLDGLKNPVGAFHPPLLTAVDPAVLRTLPRREWRQGWAELVKTAVLGDARLFRELERRRTVLAAALGAGRADRSVAFPRGLPWRDWLEHAARVKIRVVESDFRERGPRRALNLGHTLGHALEKVRGIPHGEAVALGTAAAARLAAGRGLCTARDRDRIVALLAAGGLPVTAAPPPARAVAAAVRRDKKTAGGTVRWVLPAGIGRVALDQAVTVTEALAALAGDAPTA